MSLPTSCLNIFIKTAYLRFFSQVSWNITAQRLHCLIRIIFNKWPIFIEARIWQETQFKGFSLLSLLTASKQLLICSLCIIMISDFGSYVIIITVVLPPLSVRTGLWWHSVFSKFVEPDFPKPKDYSVSEEGPRNSKITSKNLPIVLTG